MTKAEGLTKVESLINDFGQNEKHYLSKDFQETEARNRFIDPFFEALGWDFHQTSIHKNEWDVYDEPFCQHTIVAEIRWKPSSISCDCQ